MTLYYDPLEDEEAAIAQSYEPEKHMTTKTRHSDYPYMSCSACEGNATQLSHWLEAAREVTDQRDDLVTAAKAVLNIVNNSNGIDGWHMNGDIAHWGEFDEFNALEEAIAQTENT